MIKVNFSRVEPPYGDSFTDPERQLEITDALARLIRFEFGFGCSIVDLTENSITVVTKILGKIDKTSFTADSIVEFKPFIIAAALWAEISTKQINDGTLADRVMKITKGRPLYIQAFSGFIAGMPYAKQLFIWSLLESAPDLEFLTSLDWDDLIPAVELLYKKEATISDIKDVLAVQHKSFIERRLEAASWR